MTYTRWTNKQIALLWTIFPTASRTDLEREFYPRPYGSIATTAYKLGMRKRRRWMDVARAHSPSFTFSGAEQ